MKMLLSRNINQNTPELAPPEVDPLLQPHIVPCKDTTWKQYLAAFLASLISLSTGCVGGWSSLATPSLLRGTSDLGIRALSIEEASWAGSLINLGAFFGSIPIGYLSFRYGRKTCLLILSWYVIIGWLLIIFNQNNVWFLYFGRFISGISYGSMNVALPIYNNEICCDRIRGRIGTMYDLLQSVGLLYVYLCGAIFSVFWTTIFSLLIPLIFFVTFLFMPESPLYYVRIGESDRAIQSIKWLYGKDCDIHEKLRHIHRALQEGKPIGEMATFESDSFSFRARVKNFLCNTNKITMKTVLLVFFLFLLQRTCGATMVQYYGDSIFELSHSSLRPSYATVVIGIISVLGSVASITTVDTLGRRFLLTFSFFVMSLSLLVFLFAIVQGNSSSTDGSMIHMYGLVPVISLCFFIAMFRLGVSPVPWIMAPEVIPTEAQKWAPSAIVCITWGTSFLLSKNFLPAIEAFGQVAVYSFFLLVCVISFFYTIILIPETKNKSREQIQSELGASASYDDL